jgi:hypothetical protein
MYPIPDPAMPELISNHGLRMIEATLRAANIEGLDLHVYDLHDASADALTEELVQLDPDVIGFSTYLWSFPLFAEVAVQLHRDDPSRRSITTDRLRRSLSSSQYAGPVAIPKNARCCRRACGQ